YLVVVNPRKQFGGDRFRHVETSQARYLFSQYDDLGVPHPRLIKFQLGTRGGTDFSNPDVLHFTQNSPYVALCLAIHMGATRIGLIGVDFTESHFFGNTGTHPMAGRLDQINREYGVLEHACRAMGVEVVNLSPLSRITAFRREDAATFAEKGLVRAEDLTKSEHRRRIFFVNYRFLSCGDVFRDGLRHGAQELNIDHDEAYWDDPQLPQKVRDFSPDLLFVVHGRKFAQRWNDQFRMYSTAIWLLDEPYEVDDTSRFSGFFDTVFVSDPATLGRHINAHYLPVCFDPRVQYRSDGDRKYDVGFIGGYNPVREKLLESLYDEGLLSYVVGGPWNGKLRNITLSANISHLETAELYRQTKIVVNIFRSVHHFNRGNLPACSLNPRVYEALACGAAVVSEHRPEAEALFPEMPLFRDGDQLKAVIKDLLKSPDKLTLLLTSCRENLSGNSYADRLRKIVEVVFKETLKREDHDLRNYGTKNNSARSDKVEMPDGWERICDVLVGAKDGAIELTKDHNDGPGTESGLASTKSYAGVELSFEVNISNGSSFVAKLHQEDQYNQRTNSYHLLCAPAGDSLAKHHH